ncbi:MAG: diaminopimelate decarboxylase [Elusimicrobia bacterium RIFOXYC2_FULL_34_12]|nr:MAG: diaminopimelate decarboxylase [Elusimicrobia bacterium RIFOXYC2_FULL_34_12]OGS38423.1 MAG: diaminopimelate decarboxylase [Elusimicrobia bacterium RIFOXYD2_FULL_34_30]HAM39612.1 diaminopimelate decarboxylase [Elusimicrobiota bacterium]
MLEYKNNFLFIDEVSVLNISTGIDTPFYLYSKNKLLKNYAEINNSFKKANHIICYAVKANENPYLLRILAKNGCGCDIVSIGELNLALKAGINPKKIVFAGVGKQENEIRAAIKSDILMFNIESIPELYSIDRIAKLLNKTARIAFRVNPDIDAKTHPHITTGLSHNKFGLTFKEAYEGYLLAKGLKNIEIVGIHTHIGSQITDSASFVLASKKVAGYISKLKAAGINLKYIDMGGGLGIRYKDEKVINPSDYADAILKYLPKNHTIILEPGRFLVAETGVLITKVIYVKKTLKKKFLVVDAGMNDLVRPAIYGAYHEIIPVKWKNGKQHNWDIVGPICESSDVFAKDRLMPLASEGDYLAILCAGAYGYSMSSNYNMRPRPAEIIIENNKWRIIRKREIL